MWRNRQAKLNLVSLSLPRAWPFHSIDEFNTCCAIYGMLTFDKTAETEGILIPAIFFRNEIAINQF